MKQRPKCSFCVYDPWLEKDMRKEAVASFMIWKACDTHVSDLWTQAAHTRFKILGVPQWKT